jgi:hypothetical protein
MASFAWRIFVWAILSCTSVLSATAQTLEVSPSRIMADESLPSEPKGLEPHERVTMRAELTDGAGQLWTSRADFIADAQGVVDASTQGPVAGSYKPVSAMGSIWSMLPSAKHVATYTPIRAEGPQPIVFQLLRKGEAVSKANLEQAFVADGVQEIPVHTGPLRRLLCAFGQRQTSWRPGGGSNGGLPRRPAAWLASYGFAALALGVFPVRGFAEPARRYLS